MNLASGTLRALKRVRRSRMLAGSLRSQDSNALVSRGVRASLRHAATTKPIKCHQLGHQAVLNC